MALYERISREAYAGATLLATGFAFGALAYARHERRRRQKAEKLARHDHLTGLHNRRALDEAFDHMQALHRRGQGPSLVTGMLIDLDHFKRINDTMGHDAGDGVLREVGQIIRDTVRTTDFAFRYGGEELGVLMPGTSVDGAVHLSEKLNHSFRSNANVSATIGVGLLDLGKDLMDNLNPLDVALYVGKRNGRNQTVTADHPEVQSELKKLP